MLLDIIYEDMHLNGDGGEHFNSETLCKDYIYLHRYLDQYIVPLCTYIDEEIKSVHKVTKYMIDFPMYVTSHFIVVITKVIACCRRTFSVLCSLVYMYICVY